MPKYQIIFQSKAHMPDDELFRFAEELVFGTSFEVISALNLEGIREEVWKKPVVESKTPNFEDLL